MSSARRPEHGDAAAFEPVPHLPPSLAPDTTPAGLFAAKALGDHPAHLMPCLACGALNGRSALACWSCEADLIALGLFRRHAAKQPHEPVVEPALAAAAITAEAPETRRGLHLVSRGETTVAIETALAPAGLPDLPVLTALVEEPAMADAESAAPALRPRRLRRPDRRLVVLVLVAVALLAAATALRWWAPVAVPATASPPPRAAPPRGEAGLDRPFAAPAQADVSGHAELSFPPVDVAPALAAPVRPNQAAPRGRPAPPTRALSAAPRPAPKPREIRETISPPPAACTSNMAALGFCTLPPAPAKE